MSGKLLKIENTNKKVKLMTVLNYGTDDEAHAVAKINDGGYVMAGFAGNDISLAKISPSKKNRSLYNIEWAKTGSHPDINFTGGVKLSLLKMGV